MSTNPTSLVDFSDIYTAICEALKVPTTDGVTLGRIKRDINIIYLDHIIPFKPRAWWWLEYTQDVQTYLQVVNGTISATNGSTTITFSAIPVDTNSTQVSLTNYWFRVTGTSTIYKISAHTLGSKTATLSMPYQEKANAVNKAYQCWCDFINLNSNIKEVVQLTHDRRPEPIEARSNVEFEKQRVRNPSLMGYPFIYNATKVTTEVTESGAGPQRILRWWPANDNKITMLHVVGRQHASKLVNDTDEPLMPIEDRISIFYGACSFAWARERNETEAQKHWNLFTMKLTQMAAKSEDAPNKTETQVDPDYTIRKRYRRIIRSPQGRRWEAE